MEELYKRYRPKKLEDVVGQPAAIKQIRTFLDKKTLPHAVLLCGPSGTGKTTLARIIRRELDCGDVDYKELNSADFRGIDTMREIRKISCLKPMAGPVRVFLLDEAHKGTSDAQNAILKALEDTPPHVYYLLATTEPEKLITTVRNRCTTIALESLSYKEIKAMLSRIVEGERLSVPPEVISRIARAADGSARSAAVLLHKVAHLPSEDQESAIFSDPERSSKELCSLILKGADWKDLVPVLQAMEKQEEAERMRRAVMGYVQKPLCQGGKIGERAAAILEVFQYDLEKGGWPVFYLYCYKLAKK